MRAWLLAVLLVALSGCQQVPAPLPGPPPPSMRAIPASAHVSGFYPRSCTARGLLPDPSCTPGAFSADITPAVLGSTLCSKTWSTRSIRLPTNESDRVKAQAMTAYGIRGPPSVVELDHLVPLELGGSNDVSNLWPEVSDLPGRGFHNSKDNVENDLHDLVCRKVHPLKLETARRLIASDWTTARARATAILSGGGS